MKNKTFELKREGYMEYIRMPNRFRLSTYTMLGISLILLNLMGIIDIPWSLAIAPLWLPYAVGIIISIGYGLLAVVVNLSTYFYEKFKKKNRRY